MNDNTPRRSGGRNARRASRAAPLDAAMRPIRPGMEGGTYKPLTPAQVERIHQTALDALEQIGLADAPPSGVEYLTGAGAILGDDGRIRFPRALVEDTLAKANRSVTLYRARSEARSGPVRHARSLRHRRRCRAHGRYRRQRIPRKHSSRSA